MRSTMMKVKLSLTHFLERAGRMFGPVDIDLIVGRAVVVIWPPSSMSTL